MINILSLSCARYYASKQVRFCECLFGTCYTTQLLRNIRCYQRKRYLISGYYTQLVIFTVPKISWNLNKGTYKFS